MAFSRSWFLCFLFNILLSVGLATIIVDLQFVEDSAPDSAPETKDKKSTRYSSTYLLVGSANLLLIFFMNVFRRAHREWNNRPTPRFVKDAVKVVLGCVCLFIGAVLQPTEANIGLCVAFLIGVVFWVLTLTYITGASSLEGLDMAISVVQLIAVYFAKCKGHNCLVMFALSIFAWVTLMLFKNYVEVSLAGHEDNDTAIGYIISFGGPLLRNIITHVYGYFRGPSLVRAPHHDEA